MSDAEPRADVELVWTGSETFRARNPRTSVETILDGASGAGMSPMDTLLSALVGCMGVDVVLILEKMRTGFEGLRITVSGERQEEPPRYFRRLRLRFEIEGDVPRRKAERAVKLSFDKYCSVYHSLRPDIDVDSSVSVVPARR